MCVAGGAGDVASFVYESASFERVWSVVRQSLGERSETEGTRMCVPRVQWQEKIVLQGASYSRYSR